MNKIYKKKEFVGIKLYSFYNWNVWKRKRSIQNREKNIYMYVKYFDEVVSYYDDFVGLVIGEIVMWSDLLIHQELVHNQIYHINI